jgi:hypothetical protein
VNQPRDNDNAKMSKDKGGKTKKKHQKKEATPPTPTPRSSEEEESRSDGELEIAEDRRPPATEEAKEAEDQVAVHDVPLGEVSVEKSGRGQTPTRENQEEEQLDYEPEEMDLVANSNQQISKEEQVIQSFVHYWNMEGAQWQGLQSVGCVARNYMAQLKNDLQKIFHQAPEEDTNAPISLVQLTQIKKVFITADQEIASYLHGVGNIEVKLTGDQVVKFGPITHQGPQGAYMEGLLVIYAPGFRAKMESKESPQYGEIAKLLMGLALIEHAGEKGDYQLSWLAGRNEVMNMYTMYQDETAQQAGIHASLMIMDTINRLTATLVGPLGNRVTPVWYCAAGGSAEKGHNHLVASAIHHEVQRNAPGAAFNKETKHMETFKLTRVSYTGVVMHDLELDLTTEDFQIKEEIYLEKEKRENVYWKPEVRARKHLQLEDHLRAGNPEWQLAYGLGRNESYGVVEPKNPYDQRTAVYEGRTLIHPGYFTAEGREAFKKTNQEPVKKLEDYRDLTIRIPRIKKTEDEEGDTPKGKGREPKEKRKGDPDSKGDGGANKRKEKRERETPESKLRDRTPHRLATTSNSEGEDEEEDEVIKIKRAEYEKIQKELQAVENQSRDYKRRAAERRPVSPPRVYRPRSPIRKDDWGYQEDFKDKKPRRHVHFSQREEQTASRFSRARSEAPAQYLAKREEIRPLRPAYFRSKRSPDQREKRTPDRREKRTPDRREKRTPDRRKKRSPDRRGKRSLSRDNTPENLRWKRKELEERKKQVEKELSRAQKKSL